MIDIQTVLTYLTLISVPVGVFYHIMTLRNQSRTREAQLFMNIYNQSFSSPPYQKAVAKLVNTPWKSYGEFVKRYHGGEEYDEEFTVAYDLIGGFFEGVGVLVRDKLLDIRYVALLMSGQTRMFWNMNKPYIKRLRVDWNAPRFWSETEYLYDELIKYIEKHPELGSPIEPPKHNR
jgi:hypothetical protein